MKLPKGKKERIQILVLALIASVGVIVAIVMFVINPQLARMKATKQSTEELKNQISKASKEVGSAAGAREKIEEIKAKLRDINDRYILTPDYDNYFVIAEPYADSLDDRNSKATTISVTQVGMRPMPRGRKNPGRNIADVFVVKLDAQAGYDGVIEMFKKISEDNPYRMIGGVQISTRGPKQPEWHNVRFELHYPTWINMNIVNKFKPTEDKNRKKRQDS